MPSLSEILNTVRESDDYRRVRLLAANDYKLMAELVALRKRVGLRQSDVAERLGVSQQAVSKLESYDSDPKLSTIRLYANAIGALVGHSVEEDTGQLSESSEWVVTSFVMPKANFSSTSNTYAAPVSAKADFALVA